MRRDLWAEESGRCDLGSGGGKGKGRSLVIEFRTGKEWMAKLSMELSGRAVRGKQVSLRSTQGPPSTMPGCVLWWWFMIGESCLELRLQQSHEELCTFLESLECGGTLVSDFMESPEEFRSQCGP